MNFRCLRSLSILLLVPGVITLTSSFSGAMASNSPRIYSIPEAVKTPLQPNSDRDLTSFLLADNFGAVDGLPASDLPLIGSDLSGSSTSSSTLVPGDADTNNPSDIGTFFPENQPSSNRLPPNLDPSAGAVPMPIYQGDESFKPPDWFSQEPIPLEN
jgi:hypothetical protein